KEPDAENHSGADKSIQVCMEWSKGKEHISYGARQAGRGIDLLSQYQWRNVHQYITDHTAHTCRKHTQHHGCNRTALVCQGLFNAYHGEETNPQSVEQEQCTGKTVQVPIE